MCIRPEDGLKAETLEETKMTRTYACYTDESIWGIGSTGDSAKADAQQYVDGELNDAHTAPMTKYMAKRVEEHGFNGKCDTFGVVNGVVVSGRAYWRLSGDRNR
jgi:hypothetical protein